ncbi:hypothetical protein CR513_00713, partial [Mucuna pruriens]
MSHYQIVFGKACHLQVEIEHQNATWPTTKPENKGSSSYTNWMNSTWKPMRTPESISKRLLLCLGCGKSQAKDISAHQVESQPKSRLDQTDSISNRPTLQSSSPKKQSDPRAVAQLDQVDLA